MAKKTGSKKGSKATAKNTVAKEKTNGKGRTPRKGGLHDKIAWVNAQFCAKGKTRPEAAQGLLKKYPDMSENYARTIVYSQMSEYTFVAARGKGKAATSKKKAASSTSKKSTSSKSSKGKGKDESSKKSSSSKKKSTKPAPANGDDLEDDFDDF